MSQAASFDVGAFLDRQRIGRTQILVLALCMLAMAIDGYDMFVVGFVLPAIAKDFTVSPAAVTPVLVVQQIGLAIGSLVVGPLADRFGRRTMLCASALAFGIFTLLATQAHSVTQLAVLRLLAGLFFSGVVPNAIALTTEIAPHRLRATLVTIMYCGFTGGSALGGILAAHLLGAIGWRGAFWGGGLLPILLVPLFRFALPESLRFRVERDAGDPRIPGMLRSLDPALRLGGSERFSLDEEKVRGMRVGALFRDGRAAPTLLLWFSFFMNLLAINLIAAWIPTFFRIFGHMSLERAVVVSTIAAWAGVAVMLFYGRVMDALGAARILTASYVLGAAGVALLGIVDWNSWFFYLAIVIEGAFIIGGQSGLNALSATLYPTGMRATGVGWAFAAGRIGSMAGPAVGGFMLASHWTRLPVFLTMALPVLLVAFGTLLVGFGAPEGGKTGAAAAGAE